MVKWDHDYSVQRATQYITTNAQREKCFIHASAIDQEMNGSLKIFINLPTYFLPLNNNRPQVTRSL